MSRLRELEAAYELLRHATFPPAPRSKGPFEDDLRDVAGTLLEYDGAVAGVAYRVIRGSDIPPEFLPILDFNHGLRARVETMADANGPERDVALQYLAHLNILEQVLDLAKDVYTSDRVTDGQLERR